MALGMDAYLRSLGGDEDLSDFRTGEVADDVPVLEVAAQRLVELYRHHIEHAVIVSAVDGCRNRVKIQFLCHLECLGGNGDPAYVNLDPEARIGGNALGGVTESAADEISSAGDDSGLREASGDIRLEIRTWEPHRRECLEKRLSPFPARAVPYRPLPGRR